MFKKPGAKAIVAYKGKMILILRDDIPTIPFPNFWAPPGGGIEEGENPDVAIRRELAEEILVVPEKIYASDMIAYDDKNVVYRFFALLSPDEYAKVALGDEGQRLDWFTYDEAFAAKIAPHFKMYLEKQKDKICSFLERSLL